MTKRALLSVSDKTGIVQFARSLHELGYELVSTGGTEKAIKEANLPVKNISEITGFPECLDGRVKTLHPAVHAGFLALRDDKEHMATLRELNLNTIDVLAVNLYPFEATVKKSSCPLAEAVENIDIGGPAMLRSAAKNYKGVLVAVSPTDYDEIIERLKNKTDDDTFRLKLMGKVYRHTAYYDTVIADYLAEQTGENDAGCKKTYAYNKIMDLRYGENPHQSAAFYKEWNAGADSLAGAEQLQGKELSYNNIGDAYGAIELVKEFDSPAAVAIKHANPCGVALGADIFEAYKKAYECDPVSIFGGIVALNREVDRELAAELVKIFLEIVIAPSFTDGALEVLTAKPNLRVLKLPGSDKPSTTKFNQKFIGGGLLVQGTDDELFDELKTVTRVEADDAQMRQLEFAYKVVKHAKSNAIVLSKDFAAVGIGSGQTSRIWAAEQAIARADEKAKGSVAASDAFFPFYDCAEVLADAGVAGIIQPGGSKNDQDSINVCNMRGLFMVFAGKRHFRH
ncbi:MAG: bifunctional phosphoribosylaminoimidazolecarboxamide formyltransferase/IMP cyclohydrolase [Firmicutes bacterium]|nr:bifunctional phosphoribosylaminoimidazolecarboxamide formyltransferase/IMP cyclohydrolase [Bacillota bacterium]